MMTVVNNLLVIYYLMLLVGYSFIGYFIFSRSAVQSDLLGLDFGTPTDMLREYMGTLPVSYFLTWLIESFATFFFTCCAFADALIVIISAEHGEAWLMQQRAKCRANGSGLGEDCDIEADDSSFDGAMRTAHTSKRTMRAPTMKSIQDERFAVEELVVKDWLQLIRDPNLPSPLDEKLGLTHRTFERSSSRGTGSGGDRTREPRSSVASTAGDGGSIELRSRQK